MHTKEDKLTADGPHWLP